MTTTELADTRMRLGGKYDCTAATTLRQNVPTMGTEGIAMRNWFLAAAVIASAMLLHGKLSAQVKAVHAGSVEMARLIAEAKRVPPDVEGPKISLRDIDEQNSVAIGTEGILYWGGGVSGNRLDANSSTFTVIQVIDDENLLIQFFGKPWWVEMPTKGIADNTRLDLSKKVFAFVGTKRYDTALGTKTVFHFKYVKQAEMPPAADLKPVRKLREWTDTTGVFSVQAEFVGFESGKVVLKKENDEVLRVSPDKLRAEDVKWYRDELKARAKAEAAAKAAAKPPKR